MYLGIEIGGTKLQIGIGPGDGTFSALWRGEVDSTGGGNGIREQIARQAAEMLATIDRTRVRGIGVGFGGPTDDETQSVIKSHHVAGWDGFPLAAWLTELLGPPAVICNDADVAGLAEARLGAGKGLSPIFYITVGTGIGGGLIIDGEVYRGVGRGAAEIGHLLIPSPSEPGDVRILEHFAAGWGIEAQAARIGGLPSTAKAIAAAARQGDPKAIRVLDEAISALAFALRQLIPLICPRRIVIGGGISLMGEDLFFTPLRRKLDERPFEAFAGLTDIVPAALGEEVVIHGALALARQRLSG